MRLTGCCPTSIQLLRYILYYKREFHLLSPLKQRDVRRRNFARGCVPSAFRTWAGSYVDGGHRWGENEILKTLCLHFCCSDSKAAAICCYIDLDLGRVGDDGHTGH